MQRRFVLSLALAGLVGGMAIAQDEPIVPERVPVYCGSFTCFYFRATVEGKDPGTRANEAMDTINKYLGGKTGKVTTKPVGKNIRLLLNNDLVALVTPADAEAEKQKKVELLAARWSKLLETAFNESKAQK